MCKAASQQQGQHHGRHFASLTTWREIGKSQALKNSPSYFFVAVNFTGYFQKIQAF
jgi:hypothetical protein